MLTWLAQLFSTDDIYREKKPYRQTNRKLGDEAVMGKAEQQQGLELESESEPESQRQESQMLPELQNGQDFNEHDSDNQLYPENQGDSNKEPRCDSEQESGNEFGSDSEQEPEAKLGPKNGKAEKSEQEPGNQDWLVHRKDSENEPDQPSTEQKTKPTSGTAKSPSLRVLHSPEGATMNMIGAGMPPSVFYNMAKKLRPSSGQKQVYIVSPPLSTIDY
jgi:hypothetical protein